MHKNQITIPSVQLDAALEARITKQDAHLKELAEKNAKHFAARNLPAATGDGLVHYVGELKAGYEKLAADVFQYLQPAAHFPEVKIDADHFKERDANLDAEISAREHQNHNDQYSLPTFNPGGIHSRIRWAVIATLIIFLGEVLFNTKSFQVTGENMLFALILSISVSFAVFLFSHMMPILYKDAKTKLRKRLVILGTLLLATVVFIALAIFRSQYLATHDVYIKPVYFVIINLFFFIVSSLLSFFVLPTWLEMKEHTSLLKLHKAIHARTKEIKQLKKEKEALKQTFTEETKRRIRIVHCANYSADRFRKMYGESVAIFKRTNLAFRSDGRTPECFSEELPEIEINDIPFTIINRKAQ